MSLTDVKAFYSRLASDDSFRDRLSNVKTKAECTQIVQEAGYNFTDAEYEEYTNQLLDSTSFDELEELEQKELEAVFGGASALLDRSWIVPIYGGPSMTKFPKNMWV